MKLAKSKLCLDCDEVYPDWMVACPACGGSAFAWLALWIYPMAGRPAAGGRHAVSS